MNYKSKPQNFQIWGQGNTKLNNQYSYLTKIFEKKKCTYSQILELWCFQFHVTGFTFILSPYFSELTSEET